MFPHKSSLKMTSCVFFVYQVLLLYINVIVKDRLQTAFFHILIHTGERTSVIDLKLLISYVCIFLAFVFLLMISNSCGYTGRNLCCTDLGNAVSESSAFTAGYSNTCKWQENTVCTENLAKFFFPYIPWIDLVIIDDRTQSWTA